jgi:hypothetical protein
MAAAVSRRDPQQRLMSPQAITSKQPLLQQPGALTDAGKRTGANAPAAPAAPNNKRVKKDVDSDSSSSEALPVQTQPSRL